MYPAAAASLSEAIAIYKEVGNRHGHAEALNRIGVLFLESSGHDVAIGYHQQALRLAQDAHVPLEEARALEGIGRCLFRASNPDDGTARMRQALAIYQRLGVPEAKRVSTMLAELVGSSGHC